MDPVEHEELGPAFAEDALGLVVAYTRRAYAIVELPDGTFIPTLKEAYSSTPTTASFDAPLEAIAGTGGKAGTDLYISISVIKLTNSSPYKWQISGYARWGFKQFPTGASCCNNKPDYIGVAWTGNDLGLYSSGINGALHLLCWCLLALEWLAGGRCAVYWCRLRLL